MNDLRGRFAGQFRPFNPFIALYELACAAGNLRNSERVTVPFHQVTVAPTLPAALEHWIERIALVGWTMKHLGVDNIAVERAVGLPHVATVICRIAGYIRIGRSHAALRSPAVHDRVPVAGVIHIHVISQAIWCWLLVQLVRLAWALARANAGRSIAARIAMIAITTSNSISVKPQPPAARVLFIVQCQNTRLLVGTVS